MGAWSRLWRAVPAGADDGVFVSSCWTPDPLFALTFGGMGGALLRGSLAVGRVTVSGCEGLAGEHPEHGNVWHADDPEYREHFARQGVDWLTYDDASGHCVSYTMEGFGPMYLYDRVGLGIHHLKRAGRCWRVVSDRGCAALRVTARVPLPDGFWWARDRVVPVPSERLPGEGDED